MKNKAKDKSKLLRYLEGEMTNAERNSFEKELERDPFLAEALEGYESSGHHEAEHELRSLDRRISRRTAGKRKYFFYRIAASIAVLMIISSVFIVIERNRPEKTEVLPEYRTVTMDIARSEPIREPEERESPKQAPPPPAKKSAIKPRSATREEKQVSYDMVPEKREVMAEEAPANALEQPVREGRMRDSNNRLLAEEKAVSYPAAAARSSIKGVSPGQYTPPQPADGKEAFDKYVNENIRRPDTATAGQRVVVVTAFRVKPNGSPDSIRIVKSPGRLFSDEAIRLIKEGPAWKPAMRNGVVVEDEVEVRIVFP